MTKTTQPPATTASDVREILLAIADELAEGPYYRTITEADRLTLILNEVALLHGAGLPALNLDRAVRQAAPSIEWELTRGEYALILRRAAGGAQ
ncbi:hypothetical protein [Streptomyces sp. NPDC006638]|uniref:hypothetical protein n=1 Tax=Streptomyces sp. NPDC006638 TaxID=3157183 RepID=UPI0033A930F3